MCDLELAVYRYAACRSSRHATAVADQQQQRAHACSASCSHDSRSPCTRAASSTASCPPFSVSTHARAHILAAFSAGSRRRDARTGLPRGAAERSCQATRDTVTTRPTLMGGVQRRHRGGHTSPVTKPINSSQLTTDTTRLAKRPIRRSALDARGLQENHTESYRDAAVFPAADGADADAARPFWGKSNVRVRATVGLVT